MKIQLLLLTTVLSTPAFAHDVFTVGANTIHESGLAKHPSGFQVTWAHDFNNYLGAQLYVGKDSLKASDDEMDVSAKADDVSIGLDATLGQKFRLRSVVVRPYVLAGANFSDIKASIFAQGEKLASDSQSKTYFEYGGGASVVLGRFVGNVQATRFNKDTVLAFNVGYVF